MRLFHLPPGTSRGCVRALVLQLHIVAPAFGPSAGVMMRCSGLVLSAPVGPRQNLIRRSARAQIQMYKQVLDLRHGERDQFLGGRSPFFALTRCTERNAWANIARVMKRYHALHFLTSY